MKVIGIVGFKKSGKTSLGVSLSKALTEMGHSVAVVKHVSEDIDLPESDSSKYSAYAEVVAAVSSERMEIIQKGGKILEDVLAYLDSDIVLVEGFKREKTFPKIVCLREKKEKDDLVDGLELFTAGFQKEFADYNISDPVHLKEMARLAWEKAFKLPNLDCGHCGYEGCYDLAREIVKGKETTDTCVSLDPPISVRIDGQSLPLNDYTNTLFRNIVLAMLSNLKGYKKGNIEIEIP